MRKRQFLLSAVIIFSIISLTCVLSAKQPDSEMPPKPIAKEEIFENLELFADAITLIEANYVTEVGSKDLIYGALDGMLSSLDSHSSFMAPEDFKDIQEETLGEFGGIGIQVAVRDEILTVVSPLEGTPAFKAGILPGDKILRINNENTKSFNMDEIVKKLRGSPGTKVKLTILREGEDTLRMFDIRRAMIKIKSVKDAMILDNGIGYIRIAEFQRRTSGDLEKSIKRLLRDGMNALILDLRNNPGGLLEASILVSEEFLKKGDLIVSTKGRIEQQNAEFRSKAARSYTDFPIVVLANRGSASASEIVAAALRDNNRALIVGEKTFGKGSVQTVVPMPDGSALRLTTSLYYTPLGAVIHEIGLMPDVEVKMPAPESEDEDERPSGKNSAKMSLAKQLMADAQIKAAIELLKDKNRYKELLDKK